MVVVFFVMGVVHQISYVKQMSLQNHPTTIGSNQRSPATTVEKDPSPPQLVFLGKNTAEVIEGTTPVKDVPQRKLDNDNDDYHHPDDNGDWSDLSPEAKEAARALGYTKDIWDKDGSSLIDDMDWKDLSHEQKGAARVLGYTEFNWG
jgi:hypothetical protein